MSASAAGGFVPPFVRPARRPLRFPFNLAKILSNNVALIPEAAYHEPVVIAPGPPRMAFVTGEEAVEAVLQTGHEAFPRGKLQNDALSPLFRQALISLEGEAWRRQRRAVAPLFRHDELIGYSDLMRASAEATLADWRAAGSGPRDIGRDMLKAAFRVVSRTFLAGGTDPVLAAIEEGHAAFFRNINWLIVWKMLGLPDGAPRPGRRGVESYSRLLRGELARIVALHRAGGGGADDLIDRLVAVRDPETGKGLSDDQILDTVFGLLVAGYDTTALSLAWTLYLLARAPDWAERLRAEVAAVAGDGPVLPEHFERFVLVRQVISESLRLFPTAPVIVRETPVETVLEGHLVPAGTILIIPIYAIHRHRALWRDPDRFDPQRFAPDAPVKPTRTQYLPFGAGPRICIGASFAMMELLVMIATFARGAAFTLLPGPEPIPTGRLFLAPQTPLLMRVGVRS